MGAKEYCVLFVFFDLPTVRWVNLFDVDDKELDLIRELAVDLVEDPSLGPKRRSGVAAEDQRNGTRIEIVRERQRRASVWALSG